MKVSAGELALSEDTRKRMVAVFEANEPRESAVLLRLAAAREKRRLAHNEHRIRRRYAWIGALATMCLCGTAFGVAVQSGYVAVIPSPSPPRTGQELAVDPSPRIASPERNQLDMGEVGESPMMPVLERSPQAADLQEQSRLRFRQTHSNKRPQTALEAEQNAHWQEVARAMRAGEDARAREAITPLTESADRETRDSAELVRLRIELGSDQAGKLTASHSQRTRLEQLANEGASPSIRASARRLIERLIPVGVSEFRETEK